MAGINKAILIGNLGRDPELRYTKGGQAVANFSLATSESYTTKDGRREDRTEWHRIVVWGRVAENCAQYLAKGRTVYIEGRIQTQEWENFVFNDTGTTEIVAQTVQFLGGPRREGGGRGPDAPGGGGGPEGSGGGGDDRSAPSGGGGGFDPGEPPPSEIPF
ncbi:MAG: single-stranded DNA-binding protein [bacterium]|nr:single-stranded DNA-binding protein [bacterium]